MRRRYSSESLSTFDVVAVFAVAVVVIIDVVEI